MRPPTQEFFHDRTAKLVHRVLRSRWETGALLTLALGLCVGCQPALEDLVARFLRGQIADSSLAGFDPGERRYEPQSFVNWETPPIAPLSLAADGSRLLVANTADNALQVIDVSGDKPRLLLRVPVGLDPISVRARTNDEAWVANHISDSVSIVDLVSGLVVRTLHPGDEPTDIAFANGRAFIVCSQENRVAVYALDNLDASPQYVQIDGEDPRAIAISPAGDRAYVTIFESGNRTTVIPEDVVSSDASPYGGQNPIPILVDPAAATAASEIPIGPPTAVIVRQSPGSNSWLDENGADWTTLVPHEVRDHDVAVIDTATLAVSYISDLMNLNMALAVRPDGTVSVVGTDATNDMRFESRLTGKFVRSRIATFSAETGQLPEVADLNPQLAAAYAAGDARVGPDLRRMSIADPRALAWSAAGDLGYVAGLGSNNVAVIDASAHRLDDIAVGQGPSGLALDDARGMLYVWNRFDATLMSVDVRTRAILSTTALPDPTPAEIKAGRPFLYDAVRTSGLGVTACAACHVDGRMDQLAWDLGDPFGQPKTMNQPCLDVLALNDSFFGGAQPQCEDFHPLKGPLVTQTLQGIIGTEPLHWRGDQSDLGEFNPAFVGLNGADQLLTEAELGQFQGFLNTIAFPPNPNRNIDNTLRSDLGGADAVRGREIYLTQRIDEGNRHTLDVPRFVLNALEDVGPTRTCVSCHELPLGTNRMVVPRDALSSRQSIKVPQLRNMHEKAGTPAFSNSARGFGFTHDGDRGTLEEFLSIGVFNFGDQEAEQRRRDVIAFVLSFSTDTHAGVGQQVTLAGAAFASAPPADSATESRIAQFLSIADSGQVGLVVHGRLEGLSRGFAYLGRGLFQSDRAGETASATRLSTPAPDEVFTWTLVPLGSANRIGIDSDGDGVLDGD